jgi:hypothetical protein
MKLLTSIAVARALLSGSAGAADHCHGPQAVNCPWVLLGLGASMGQAVFQRDTAKDADITIPLDGGDVPIFETKAACQAALRRAIKKYEGLSHAQGNYGMYLCTNYATWMVK